MGERSRSARPTVDAADARLDFGWWASNGPRVVRTYLTGRAELADPPAVNILGASVLFTAPEEAYRNLNFALVANQLGVVTNGHYFEQTEVWSESGALLVTAHVLRRNQRPEDPT
jgi:hypothetical protein